MTRKSHKHALQINPLHHEEEARDTNDHTYRYHKLRKTFSKF